MCLAGSDALLSISNTCVDTQEDWERILTDAGLSMDRGSSPAWLSYGWKYTDSNKACDYTAGEKRPHKRTVENERLGRQLIHLMASGLSQNAAAKAMGIGSGAASNALRRYRVRRAAR